ncbi:GTPase IMAP family member 8-like [Branchiostoma lanceolatum]|uniref:GTPase IMAP family member 8-like n=1 Tax=Branchiostoma lanceolatum TaxID=7740 RepID=UPI003456845F
MAFPDMSKALNSKRSVLKENLRKSTIDSVLDQLVGEELIDTAEYQKIRSQSTDHDQATELLDYIMTRGPIAVKSFHGALRKTNSFLAEEIDSAFEESLANNVAEVDGAGHSSNQAKSNTWPLSEATSSRSTPSNTSASTSQLPQTSQSQLEASGVSEDATRTATPQPVSFLVVGCAGNGKSELSNAIIGHKGVFRVKRKARDGTTTAKGKCLLRRVDNGFWEMTVIDTPGISKEMTESQFHEVVNGVELSRYGLDAIILTWSYMKSFDNEEREYSVFKSLHRLLGNGFLSRLVIVITGADDVTMSKSEILEGLPECMKEIVQHSQGRVLLMSNTYDRETLLNQTSKLIDMSLKLTEKNGSTYTCKDLSPRCQIPSGEELRLALLGKTGAGKSSTTNSILGQPASAVSCSLSSETKHCLRFTRDKGDRKISVVDTPGILDTECKDEETATLLTEVATMFPNGLHALLLVVNHARFTKEDALAVDLLKHVFGERFLQYSVMVVTGMDVIDEDEKVRSKQDYLKTAPREFLDVLKECGTRCVFFNNKTKDETLRRIQLWELVTLVEKTVELNEGPYSDAFFRKEQEVQDASTLGESVADGESPAEETPKGTEHWHVIWKKILHLIKSWRKSRKVNPINMDQVQNV